MQVRVLSFYILVTITFSFAQLDESFTDPVFPPEGWQIINNDGGNTWLRNTSNYRSSPGCAACLWSDYYLTNDDWLVTPRLIVNEADTLMFYYRSAGTAQESLEVRLSFKGPTINHFTRILWARRFNNQTYQLAKIPLRSYRDSAVYIAFRYYVGYPLQPIGIGVYLDDIQGPEIYQVHDVGATQIINPSGVKIESIFCPTAKVKNFGSYPETIPVVFKILPGGYQKHETTFLLAGTDTTIIFPPCTLVSGEYEAVAYTTLNDDEDRENDTTKTNFIIRTHNVWQRRADFPLVVKTTGSTICYGENNFIYALRASDTTFYAYALDGDHWQKKKGLPIKPKAGLGLVYEGNDTLYLMTKNKKAIYRYSITANEWYLGDSLPIKPKTNTALVRHGDYLYFLLGDTFFYRYSIPNKTWERLKGLPVKTKTGTSLAATNDDYLYAITGNKKAFHRYSIATNDWALLESVPVAPKKGAALASDGLNIFCLIGGKTKKFYRYSEPTGWQEIESLPVVIKGGSSLTAAENNIYGLLGSQTSYFYRYISDNSSPKQINPISAKISYRHHTFSKILQKDSNLTFPVYLTIYDIVGNLCLKKTITSQTEYHKILKNLGSGIFIIHNSNRSLRKLVKVCY
jgi:hypothetical protein